MANGAQRSGQSRIQSPAAGVPFVQWDEKALRRMDKRRPRVHRGATKRGRGRPRALRYSTKTTAAERVIQLASTLIAPHGEGGYLELAPFQVKFIEAFLEPGVSTGVLSCGRGNGKSCLAAVLAIADFMGLITNQRDRHTQIFAGSFTQAAITFNFVLAMLRSSHPKVLIPCSVQNSSTSRKLQSPEGHVIQAFSADSNRALGYAGTLAICDETGSWPAKGQLMEASLRSALVKREGARIMHISTTAGKDEHFFSAIEDDASEGTVSHVYRGRTDVMYGEELEQNLKDANPGLGHPGFPLRMEELLQQATRANRMGGMEAAGYRRFNLNRRVELAEVSQMLMPVEEWRKQVEVEPQNLPAREGRLIVGLDVGMGFAMTGAVAYWPDSGRLECMAAFSNHYSLTDRCARDNTNYLPMHECGELILIGEGTVDLGVFLGECYQRFGEPDLITGDTFRLADQQVAITCPTVHRRTGSITQHQDLARFYALVLDNRVKMAPSLLMRAAIRGSRVTSDSSGNRKINRSSYNQKNDVLSAMIAAVAVAHEEEARAADEELLGSF